MIDWSFEQVACDAADCTIEDLKSTERVSAEAVTARYLCFYYMTNVSNWSYGKIGKRYGGRDHSTVHYGLDKIQDYLDSKDKKFAKVFSYLIKLICDTMTCNIAKMISGFYINFYVCETIQPYLILILI